MLLFKDLFTGSDIFTDAFKYELVNDLYYVVKGKIVAKTSDIDDALIGGNKSAEVEEEENETSVEKVPNVVDAGNLQEVPTIVGKKSFKEAIQKYSKLLLAKLKETNAERADYVKSKLPEFIKSVLVDFNKYKRFYCTEGDEYELDGMIILYQQDDELGMEKVDSACSIIVFKDGCEIEPC